MKKRTILVLSLIVLIMVSTSVAFAYNGWYNKDRVRESITVELGTQSVEVELFLLEDEEDAVFVGDLSGIDLYKVASYPVQVKAGPRIYDSMIHVVDTTESSPISGVNLFLLM